MQFNYFMEFITDTVTQILLKDVKLLGKDTFGL